MKLSLRFRTNLKNVASAVTEISAPIRTFRNGGARQSESGLASSAARNRISRRSTRLNVVVESQQTLTSRRIQEAQVSLDGATARVVQIVGRFKLQ